MNETNHLMPSGGHAFDPVMYGVAHGLSLLFPPVEHPDGVVTDDAAGQASDEADLNA